MSGEKKERPIEELKAGDLFRNSMVPRADKVIFGAPLWHGWVIMDAFLAGIDYARSNNPEPAKVIEMCESIATKAAVDEDVILPVFEGRPDLVGAWQDACNHIAEQIRSLKDHSSEAPAPHVPSAESNSD